MKHKYSMMYLTVILSVSFILVSSSAPISADGLFIDESNQIKEEVDIVDPTNITEDPKWQMRSSIHGDHIVWEDYRDDPYGTWSSPSNRNSNIYIYNIVEKETYQITRNESSQVRPDIWENYVVWEDYRNGQADIFYTDISNLLEEGEVEVNQLTDDDSDQMKPRIHNGRVVWEDYRDNYFGDIYLYELIEERGPYRINTRRDYGDHEFIPHLSPDIYEDKIVWTDYRQHWRSTNFGDIYLYDLSIDSSEDGIPNYRDPLIGDDDPAEIELAAHDINQHSPSIYKETIVWTEYDQDRRNEIYLKELGEGRTRISEENEQMKDDNPQVYGEFVVYQKRKYDEEGMPTHDSIWFYNLHEDIHENLAEITTDPSYSSRVKARFPSIFQDNIVWEENHLSDHEDIDNQYDIFFTDIDPEGVTIRSNFVANETKEYSDSTEMILTHGSELHFRAEIRDPVGKIEDVLVGTSSIPGVDNDLVMDEVKHGVYEATFEYILAIQEGVTNITIEVWYAEGYIESEPMKIRFVEPVLEFNSVSVGMELDDLGEETRFIIDETDSSTLYFEADLAQFQGEVEKVYVDISSFGIEETEFDLYHIEGGIYRYEYTYIGNDDISTGEHDVRFYAIGDRGQQTESDDLTVDIVFRPPEPKIVSYGVGEDRANLYDSIDFELSEGNYVYFVVSIDRIEDVSYSVYLNMSELGTDEDRVEMEDMLDENTYYYRFEYSDGLDIGEKRFYITVEDEFEQEDKSGAINVDFVQPEEGLPFYYYLIPVVLLIILIISLAYMKKPEIFDTLKR